MKALNLNLYTKFCNSVTKYSLNSASVYKDLCQGKIMAINLFFGLRLDSVIYPSLSNFLYFYILRFPLNPLSFI